jgi:hypothetical protein
MPSDSAMSNMLVASYPRSLNSRTAAFSTVS